MEKTDNRSSRRDFLLKFGILGLVFLAVGAFVQKIILYLFPEKEKKTYHRYLVCKTNELPIGGAKEMTLENLPIFVVHQKEGFKVFSGVCTHLGCIIQWKKEKEHFYCPCHKGIFDKSGKVIGGPPPRPLDEYQIEIDKNLVYIKIKDKMKGPWA